MSKKRNNSAFSLIELSIVILIIGILIAGALKGQTLINKSRLSSARALTNSSPVPSIDGLLLWFESTSEDSFLTTQTDNNATLSRWFDINPQLGQHLYFQQDSANDGDHPRYISDCINALPCVRFSGNAAGALPEHGGMTLSQTIDGTFQYFSIFVVLTTPSDDFVPNSGSSGLAIFTSTNLNLQFTPLGKLTYPSHQPTTKGILYNAGGLATNSIATDYIFSVIDDNSANIYEYINGSVGNNAGEDGELSKQIGTLRLGYYPNTGWPQRFKGNIGEIIIYSKALKTRERKDIEKYLSQKWNIAVSH